MTGIPTQNAARPRHQPVQSAAKTRVGGDDEQADVDVVHADPRLDEEHPVGEDEQPDEAGDEAAPEEDPGEQVEQRRGQRPGDDARAAARRRRATRCRSPRTPRRASKTSSCWRSVGRVVGLKSARPGGRHEAVRQPGVGEDRVAVRLDDVDGPRPGRRSRPGARPRMWTIWLASS